MLLFRAEAPMFLIFFFCPRKLRKNQLQKLLIIGPNPAQISIPAPRKFPIAGLFHNDFARNLLRILKFKALVSL